MLKSTEPSSVKPDFFWTDTPPRSNIIPKMMVFKLHLPSNMAIWGTVSMLALGGVPQIATVEAGVTSFVVHDFLTSM